MPGCRDLLLLLTLAFAVGALTACGSTAQEDSELIVYLSGTATGEDRTAAREIAAGAELALAEAGGEAGGVAVRLRVLDEGAATAGGWSQAAIARNARAATEDSSAIAYLGEPDPASTRFSVPITNASGLLQVSPGPTPEELLRLGGSSAVPRQFQASGERTLVALLPEGAEPIEPPPADLPAQLRRAGPQAALGYEAMALVLDAIGRASDPLDRGAVVAAAFATSDRPSPLGTYSIDSSGLATLGEP